MSHPERDQPDPAICNLRVPIRHSSACHTGNGLYNRRKCARLVAWWKRWWRPAGRLHYTVIALAGLALLWYEVYWEFLVI